MDKRTYRMEAQTLGRYLIGRLPTASMIERYGEAHKLLLGQSEDERDRVVAAFAVRYPWSLPLLDAASGVLKPQGLLRNKLLLMAAILETSPDFADYFLQRDTPRAVLMAKLGCLGVTAVSRVVLGLLLYPIAAWYRP